MEARLGIRTVSVYSDGESFILSILAAEALKIQQPFVLQKASADKNIIT